MMRSKSLLLPLRYFRVACPARVSVRASASLPEWDPSLSVPNSGAAYPPEGTKEELGSEEHDHWAPVRALHSQRMVGHSEDDDKDGSGVFGSFARYPIPFRPLKPVAVKDGKAAKAIFVVSDRTRWTAEQAIDEARKQFEERNWFCPTNTHLFSGIDDMERLMEIIKEADKENALFLYALADPAMAEAAKNTCKLAWMPFADVLASHGSGEGRGGHGGAAVGLRIYIVDVEKPNVEFASPEERDAWYKSFISVDESANAEDFWESRWVSSHHESYGFGVWLTKDELAALKKKEGFIDAIPTKKYYLH